MERKQFAEGIGVISKFFGMEWPSDSLTAAYEQVSNEAIETLHAAHKRICLEFSPRPQPPMAKIVAVIIDEGKKHRMRAGVTIEDEWTQQKRGTSNDASKFFSKEKASKHGEEAIFMITGRLEGKLDAAAYIACIARMDREYLNCGWDVLLREEQIKPARESIRAAAGDI